MISCGNIYVFGNNCNGQLGIASGEELLFNPAVVIPIHFEAASIINISCAQHQSAAITDQGILLTCGENEDNALGRSGKRSCFHRVDAVETFQISEVAIGVGFTILNSKDGRIISWGRNDLGQLGIGSRDVIKKPKVNTNITVKMIQVVAGAQHVLALDRHGQVYSWGANAKGQLGDGQITSSYNPVAVVYLTHRPIVSICCGEDFSMVLTVTGNVYSWGDNSHGQLGLGDRLLRRRPELVRALRSPRVRLISAGSKHTAAISLSGLVFVFGGNSHGQLGIGDDTHPQCLPVVVDRLRELRATGIVCGSFHTLILCTDTSGKRGSVVFGTGLNSSGQLGLGHSQRVTYPAPLTLPEACVPVALASGPLSFHSFVVSAGRCATRGRAHISDLDTTALRRLIDSASATDQCQLHHSPGQQPSTATASGSKGKEREEGAAQRILREAVAHLFSSPAALNASFLPSHSHSHSLSPSSSFSVDLPSLFEAYYHLHHSTAYNDHIDTSIRRAILQSCQSLRHVPHDEVECLSVFIILLMHPLMLDPKTFHTAIDLLITGLLGLPPATRLSLFRYLRDYHRKDGDSTLLSKAHSYMTMIHIPGGSTGSCSTGTPCCSSLYLVRALLVLQGQLSFKLTRLETSSNLASICMLMDGIHTVNYEQTSTSRLSLTSSCLPESSFYNLTLSSSLQLEEEWKKWKSGDVDSPVFHILSRFYLLSATAKLKLLSFEKQLNYTLLHADINAPHPSSRYFHCHPFRLLQPLPKYLLFTPLPDGNFSLCLYFCVRRLCLLKDFVALFFLIYFDGCVYPNINSTTIGSYKINVFKLPLIVKFVDEDGVDDGGLTREFLTLLTRQLTQMTGVVGPAGDGASLWFTGNHDDWEALRGGSGGNGSGVTGGGDSSSSGCGSGFRRVVVESESSMAAEGDEPIPQPRPSPPAPCSLLWWLNKCNSYQQQQQQHSPPDPEGRDPGLIVLNEAAIRSLAFTTLRVSPAEMLGVVAGLALRHSTVLDLPLPAQVYRLRSSQENMEYSLQDLFEVDPMLAKTLQTVLQASTTTSTAASIAPLTSSDDLFGLTFAVSWNPLLDTVTATETKPSTRSPGLTDLKCKEVMKKSDVVAAAIDVGNMNLSRTAAFPYSQSTEKEVDEEDDNDEEEDTGINVDQGVILTGEASTTTAGGGRETDRDRDKKRCRSISQDNETVTKIGTMATATAAAPMDAVTSAASCCEAVTNSQTAVLVPPLPVYELLPGGADIRVTRSNGQQFVSLFLSHALGGPRSSSLEYFRRGMRKVLVHRNKKDGDYVEMGSSGSGTGHGHGRDSSPEDSLDSILDQCSPKEIQSMIIGLSDASASLSLGVLRANVRYEGLAFERNHSHPVLLWFWEIIEELDRIEQSKFLFFLSGSDRVPLGGLESWKLVIQSTSQSAASLPVAHTCYTTLDLPANYPTKTTLKEKLLLAIDNCVGFGLV